MEEAKNEAKQAGKGGIPFGIIAVFIAALIVGFAVANPGFGILGTKSPGGCHGNIEYVANAAVNTQYYAASAGNGSASTVALAEANASDVSSGGVQEIKMTVDANGWTPTNFVLKKGVKVRWVIDAETLYSCTNEVISEEYGIDIKLKTGENVVEFTPDTVGTFGFHCGMNMIRGTFIVVNDPSNESEVANATSAAAVQKKSRGCGCGMYGAR